MDAIAQAEDETSSAFSISQEDIDDALQSGSGYADSKYRIYRQLTRNLSLIHISEPTRP